MSDTLPILLFAQVRDAVGQPEIVLDWQSGDVRALRATLADAYPALAPLLPGCRIAVNQVLVPEEAPVALGDEIAILPPFGGG